MTTKTAPRVLDFDDQPTPQLGVAQVRVDDEIDRITVHANGIAVDVIANEDGSVYIETYAYQPRVSLGVRRQVVVGHAAIDRYTVESPNLRLGLVEITSDDWSGVPRKSLDPSDDYIDPERDELHNATRDFEDEVGHAR